MLSTQKRTNASWFESENRIRPKGGEALPVAAVESWYVLWTHSNSEQLVYNQLAAKGFHLFLPTIDAWSRRGGIHALARVPMFSGYLFLRQAMDKASYIEVCKARGLVRLLGERWDRLDVMPDREMEAIQKIVGTRLPILPYPYLRDG